MRPAYSFGEEWWLPSDPVSVHAVLADLGGYPSWWPQVLAVAGLGPDRARVLCRSRLPYTLDLVLRAVHDRPDLLETEVAGDLRGVARWRIDPQARGTRLRFEQDVEVGGVLALASRAVRPLLVWNHEQMLQGCREGLVQTLGRPG